MPSASTTLIGIAGVHHVVSELSRRGLVALPTVKNTAAYDIVALNPQGTRHANIQVKASSKRVLHFPMPPPAKVRTGPSDFYVLARWLDRDSRYQCFLLTGKQARAAVVRALAAQQPSIRAGSRTKEFPCINVGPSNTASAQRWADAWDTWEL